MPLIKILSTAPLRALDMPLLHKRVMEIFKTPAAGVQIIQDPTVQLYPDGVFVEMRAKSKPERDAVWMKAALTDLTQAMKEAGVPDSVRIRCETFDDTKLFKNF
eukprot:TRINITY_DN9824_c0_g1_i1.p2 TRINITY_DN9824_c0_g1~~TRINITY_DN9824_c0_g1_i1.p2  ORF type:complete len:104 (+),score=34.35 TRINITY_DN9824_c0_g1_i1:46-357(+)